MGDAPRLFGARLLPEGGVDFCLWAPSLVRVVLQIQEHDDWSERAMRRGADGWHEIHVAAARAGTRYRYDVGGGRPVPDPASCRNPVDVHGPSEVVDPRSHAWRHTGWRGRPWHEAVVYEMHIGTFTPEGSFAAASARLGALADLGITAIELMPLAHAAGTRNWGYDGVLPFAPDSVYGTPDELKSLVDHAHGLGMMVLLDVVYNHFGPEGNYLQGYCPEFFNPMHQTPWGAAVNFDGPSNAPVRRFFRDNALYWTEEFRFDGLRLDAVQQIRDDSEPHIVAEIADALRNGPGRHRHVHLVLENEANQASLLARDAGGTPLLATAQWNDDLHHCAHVLLTGQTDGYYEDFARQPLEGLGRAMAQGFVYQGQARVRRAGRKRGEPSAHLPPPAFISFLQNHDQIGNRALGERLGALADARRLDALYACLLLSPQIPMLFMGEEFAASTPFLYFCDFHGELARNVTAGRRAEFTQFAAFADPAAREGIPDPNAADTFTRSILRWEEAARSPHRERRVLIGQLLALRHRHLVPHLAGAAHGGTYQCQDGLLCVEWTLGDGTRWQIAVNLGFAEAEMPDADTWRMATTVYAFGAQRGEAGRVRLAANAVRVRCSATVGAPAAPGPCTEAN